jgi:hypothetical protein
MVCFANEYTTASSQPSVSCVEQLLLACLTDEATKNKRTSIIFSFMIWLYQTDPRFTDPDRFQHALVRAKYALKCVAIIKLQSFKHTSQDEKFISQYFRFGWSDQVQMMHGSPFAGQQIVHFKNWSL